jgi:hypothetical protein
VAEQGCLLSSYPGKTGIGGSNPPLSAKTHVSGRSAKPSEKSLANLVANPQFYWDTIFILDVPAGKVKDQTYAEIFDNPELGLKYKMTQLSQSSRTMLAFLEYRHSNRQSSIKKITQASIVG